MINLNNSHPAPTKTGPFSFIPCHKNTNKTQHTRPFITLQVLSVPEQRRVAYFGHVLADHGIQFAAQNNTILRCQPGIDLSRKLDCNLL